MGFTFTFQFVSARETIALASALPAVCIIVVALRFFTRRLQNVRVGVDDWLAVGGLLAVIGMGACLIAGAHARVMGYPTPPVPSNLTDEQAADYVDPTTVLNEKIEYPFQILLLIAYGFIKLSIVAFYRRIFVTHKGALVDLLTKITALVIFLWTITFILLIVFACGDHFWANWGSTASQLVYCPIAFTEEYGLAISDLILDVFVFVLPLPFIWRLRLTTQRKFAVSGIFLLGASAVGASIARLVLYVQTLRAVTAEVVVDINQSLTVSYYWSLLEAGLALIAACLPPMSYLFTHFNVQSIVNSVRSTLSLHSLRSSQHSSRGIDLSRNGNKQPNPYTKIEPKMSTASDAEILRITDISIEEHPMQDLESTSSIPVRAYKPETL